MGVLQAEQERAVTPGDRAVPPLMGSKPLRFSAETLTQVPQASQATAVSRAGQTTLKALSEKEFGFLGTFLVPT